MGDEDIYRGQMRQKTPLNVALCLIWYRLWQLTGFDTGSGSGGKVSIDQTTPGTTNGVVLNASASTTAVTGTQAVKTVTSAGTPEVIAAATALVDSVIISGMKARDTQNVGNVFFGWTSGNDTQTERLEPGQSISLKAPNGKKIDLNLIYVDVLNNGDGVAYTAIN